MIDIYDLLSADPKKRSLKRLISKERWSMFKQAVDYIDYELVEGDIFEFGVFTGRTLAALAYCLDTSEHKTPFQRNVVGFDSFRGLPESSDPHPRWEKDNCTVNHLQNTPTAKHGETVTEESVYTLFKKLKLTKPIIHAGEFSETVSWVLPSKYPAAALVHIDCDIYESTKTVLDAITPILQDGTVLLFDDWFHYKAHPNRGEQRAFNEFLEQHPEWAAVHYKQYATFCNAFIMSKR